MEGADGTGDDRTFRVNFSSDGVTKLRDNVKEKLKEYMGDYTDDTLVEYVIVLLKNGRRKDEARNELNVFLDDDSDSFVSWLWDHMGSNLNLYVQPPRQSHPDAVLKENTVIVEHHVNDSERMESESTKSKPDKLLKSRQTREWKGLEMDKGNQPSLQSTVTETIHTNRENRKVGHKKRSISPQPVDRRKRNRAEERPQIKREAVSQVTIAAPRRLLQFAVRDAVATSKPSNSIPEHPSKRLRSVVSSAEDLNVQEHPQRIRPVARVPNPLAAAARAAAEDVWKARSSSNVFDRLGRRNDISETLNKFSDFGDDPGDDGENETYGDIKEQVGLSFDQRDEHSHPDDMSAFQRDTRIVVDPSLADNDYDVNRTGRVMSVSHTGTSGANKGGDSQTVQHIMRINAENFKNQDRYGELWGQKLVGENEALTSQSEALVMKENSNPILGGNGNAKFDVDLQKEAEKNQLLTPGSYPTGGPTEADSRTIFVNNVHFAATKDSLSRHFNKSGAVLKVLILTDIATGQPKGSAYIEFVNKEAAENALSLDGTSFMSRILRVVRKSSAQLDASSMPWPRAVRASPYTVSRFGRPPFPRGTGVYRSRFPVKPGARSFQWKREAQSTPSETSLTGSGSTGPSSIPRSLTYVRTEAKTNGS